MTVGFEGGKGKITDIMIKLKVKMKLYIQRVYYVS